MASIGDELNTAAVVDGLRSADLHECCGPAAGHQGRRLKDERHLARQIIRQGVIDNRSRPEILQLLQDQAPRLGPWDPQRFSEAIRGLRRRRTPGIDPCQPCFPPRRRKQRVLTLTEQAIAAGQKGKAIAVLLNQAGLRPPRAMAFTPGQVRLLDLRAHGLSSFNLAARPVAREMGA